jgi:hypothetical protein
VGGEQEDALMNTDVPFVAALRKLRSSSRNSPLFVCRFSFETVPLFSLDYRTLGRLWVRVRFRNRISSLYKAHELHG